MSQKRRAILLAAGRGSRLGNLTSDAPKCMVPVHGRPLLEWQLQALRAAGITDIAIVRGYRKELIHPAQTTFFDNEQWSETNMLLSLTRASEWLRKFPCVVCYSDILFSPKTIQSMETLIDPIAMTYNVNWRSLWEARFSNPLDDAETFRVDSNGLLIEIGKKAQTLEEIQGQYMGILQFQPAGWGCVEDLLSPLSWEQQRKMDMTTLINKLIGKTEIKCVPSNDYWFEVDNERDLAITEKLFSL